MTHIMRWLTAALCGIATVGCAPTEIRLSLRSETTTNEGRPLAVVLRSMDSTQRFRSERYGEIERLVTVPDASVLQVLRLMPGGSQCVTVPYPNRGGVALYALYASPIADWRVLFSPTLPDRVALVLGRDGIERGSIRERLPRRLPKSLTGNPGEKLGQAADGVKKQTESVTKAIPEGLNPLPAAPTGEGKGAR